MNEKNGGDQRSNDSQQGRSMPDDVRPCGAVLGENPDSEYRCRLQDGHEGDHLFQLKFTKPPS